MAITDSERELLIAESFERERRDAASLEMLKNERLKSRKTLKPKAEPEFDPALVRRISLAVYKDRLDAGSGPERDGTTATQRMLAKDPDNGKRMEELSKSFDTLTRAYLRAIGEETLSVTVNIERKEP